MGVGGWWGGSRFHSECFFGGKSSQNSPKPALIFWSSIPCVSWIYITKKVVGYYDLSVLSMSVMGFQKKIGCGWVGGVSSIQFFCGIFGIFLTAKPLIFYGAWFSDREFWQLFLGNHGDLGAGMRSVSEDISLQSDLIQCMVFWWWISMVLLGYWWRCWMTSLLFSRSTAKFYCFSPFWSEQFY